jgi:hypothetical protein
MANAEAVHNAIDLVLTTTLFVCFSGLIYTCGKNWDVRNEDLTCTKRLCSHNPRAILYLCGTNQGISGSQHVSMPLFFTLEASPAPYAKAL